MNLQTSFDNLIDSTFTRVKGCLIEKTAGGYNYHGRNYATITDVEKAISQSFENLSNSIKPKTTSYEPDHQSCNHGSFLAPFRSMVRKIKQAFKGIN